MVGERSRSAAALLRRRVRANVKRGAGVTNGALRGLCRMIIGRWNFDGVYSADYLPLRLSLKPYFSVVVNLGRRRGVRGKLPVGHFVSLVGTPSTVYYTDSYGLPCFQRDILAFLKYCRRPVTTSRRRVQAWESVYCSMYACLFTAYLVRRERGRPAGFGLKFWDGNEATLMKNDRLCMKYLYKLAE